MIIGSNFYHSYTAVVSRVYWNSLIVLTILGVLYLVFAELATENFFYSGLIFAAVVASWMMLKAFHYLVKLIHKLLKVKPQKKCKSIMIIAFLIMYLISWAPRLMVLYFGYDFFVFWSMVFVGLQAITLMNHEFIRTLPCEILYSQDPTIPIILGNFFHCVFLLGLSRFGTSYDEMKDKVAIVAFQLMYFPICCVVYTDFCKVLNGEWRMTNVVAANDITNNNNNQQNMGLVGNAQVRPLRVEVVGDKADQRVDCRICRHEYTDTRTPRVLKECGHTVCEECADRLLTYSNTKYLICPFCQMVTVVKGPASLLPKNYGMMDIMDYMKDK
ncbi:unnamed protein product [Caenorhabditis brenneri]